MVAACNMKPTCQVLSCTILQTPPLCMHALQVPNLSSRLRRLPFVALCMLLLLWAAMSSRAPHAAGGFSSTEDMLSSSSSTSAGVQLPTTYSAGPSSKNTGALSSMTVAAAPILMALFLVQVSERAGNQGTAMTDSCLM